MKKIFTSLLLMTVMILGQIVPASALSYDESYVAAQNFYSQKAEITSFGELIAYEAIGLESDDKEIDQWLASDYASEIAQTVIALTLHGDDPRNYQGTNYVEMLENCVQENGAFDKQNTSTYANFQVYGVYALYVVNSPKLTLAADYLASLIDENGAFGSSYGPSLDITSWVIESLALADSQRYQETIQKAMTYLQSTQDGQAGYQDSYSGVNANTQACVLMGLLTADAQGIKDGKYNQGEYNPYDVLLSYQNEDGSFWYTAQGEVNDWATMQGIQAVGYYQNGSVYEKAHQEYVALVNATKQEQETTKPVEEKPKEPTQNDEEKPRQTTEVKEEQTKETQKADVVQTDDSSWILGYGLLFVVSGLVLLKGRKIFE